MFSLDVTGSMSDEIKASKEIIKAISTYDRSEPVDYILTTFSDPISRLNCFLVLASSDIRYRGERYIYDKARIATILNDF